MTKQLIVNVCMAALLCVSVAVPAEAGVIDTPQYLASVERQANLDAVSGALMRKDVQKHLVALGVQPEDALARVQGLPDADLALMAQQMEELPSGGSLLAVIGIVFVVLLILDLTGVTNVFSKV